MADRISASSTALQASPKDCKESLYDLAVLGGRRAFSNKLHVGRPNIGKRDTLFNRFNQILSTGWLTNEGYQVQELEKRITEMLGVRNCICICNGTVALEIAIRALDLTGEVIVPSFTFIATAHALQWQEITPVFCDIDPSTHGIDPAQIERLITPRTSGIIGVHLWGIPCRVEKLEEIAKRNHLKLLFDAAHAFNCSHRGAMVGSFGDAEVFSFHATKVFNTFEGGAVVTNDDRLARKVRLMKNFGFSGYDDVTYIGTNGKMTEVAAAMGLTSLESLDEFIEINRRNFEKYRSFLQAVPGLRMLTYDGRNKSNFQYIVIEVDETQFGLSRDLLALILHAENILARRYFFPGCHRMEPYRSYYPNASLLLPKTERLSERVLVLPSGSFIGCDDIERICQIIRYVQQETEGLKASLRGRKLEFTPPEFWVRTTHKLD